MGLYENRRILKPQKGEQTIALSKRLS